MTAALRPCVASGWTSWMEVPLAAVLGEDVVDVDLEVLKLFHDEGGPCERILRILPCHGRMQHRVRHLGIVVNGICAALASDTAISPARTAGRRAA